MVSSVDKIDVEQLLSDFRVKNKDAFQIYLKELWKDLSQRSEDKSKGISRITFSKYFELPGIILDRIFNVFDDDKNEFLDIVEFVEGMTTLFTENFGKLIKFIFRFYDFDRDNYISHEDIRVVLSYIPLNTQKKIHGNKFENLDYKDRIESQDELQIMLDSIFEKHKRLDFNTFTRIVENQNSEVCLYILIFLLEKKPFSNSTLQSYEKVLKDSIKSQDMIVSRLIASPSLNSKFSPCITIQKSPSMVRKNMEKLKQKIDGGNLGGINTLSKFTGKNPLLNKGKSSVTDNVNKLMMYTKKGTISDSIKETSEIEISESKNPVRKQRDNLKNLEDLEVNKKEKNLITTNKEFEEGDNNFEIKPATKYQNQIINLKTDKPDSDDDELNQEVRFGGFLYKLTQTKKLKKLYFKLINRDLYCKFVFIFI